MNNNVITSITNQITNQLTNTTLPLPIVGVGTPGLEYWIWASIGTLLFVLELFVPGAIFFWLGLSAMFVSVLTLLFLKTLEMQIIAWLGLSVIMIASYFAYRKKSASGKVQSRDPIFKYVGMKGDVIQTITQTKIGKVRLDMPINGILDWNAISEDPNITIEVGERVEVVGIDGIKLIVRKVQS